MKVPKDLQPLAWARIDSEPPFIFRIYYFAEKITSGTILQLMLTIETRLTEFPLAEQKFGGTQFCILAQNIPLSLEAVVSFYSC